MQSNTDNTLTTEMSTKVQKTMNELTPDRQEKAMALASKINTNDESAIISYGAEAQERIGAFSQNVLSHVKNNEVSEVGDTLAELSVFLKNVNSNDLKEPNMFQKLFLRAKKRVDESIAQYENVGSQVDAIAKKLIDERDSLMEDNKVLSELFDENLNHYHDLSVYIAAGEMKVEELETTIIPEATALANTSENQLDVQKVSDLSQFKNRLEKRIYDLKMASQMTIQQAPQIRMIQNTNQTLSEKIQTTVSTTIPLWKNQMVITTTLLKQKEAVKAQKAVSDTTNELLRQNSKMLKIGAIETAEENERAVIDIATLEQTQQDLIETLDQTLAIQKEGSSKRKVAESQLERMEGDLKQQLLALRSNPED